MVASAFKTISCVARCSIRQIPSSSMSMDTLTITVTFVGNGLVLISSMLENKVAFVYPSSNVATKCGSEILTDPVLETETSSQIPVFLSLKHAQEI
jgi:hypothetical protein